MIRGVNLTLVFQPTAQRVESSASSAVDLDRGVTKMSNRQFIEVAAETDCWLAIELCGFWKDRL